MTPPPQAVPDSFTVDFEDITWAGAITCNPDFGEYECKPHVHEQIIAKGIDITGSPNGALITRLSVGPLGSTGVMLGYITPSSTGEYVYGKDGLSENEVLTVHFLYSLANSVEAGLATITSDQPNVSDVPATIIMKAYDSGGNVVASTQTTFTGVTNGQYTPARVTVVTADSAYNISKVTIELADGSSLPYDGIFLQGLSFTKLDTQPIPNRPPAITVPNWTEEQPAVVGFDYEGAEVEYYIGSSTVAWDDNDGYITPVCDPPSGTFFPVGQHRVTCTATDSAGNTGSATFVVYVKDLADSAPEEPFTPTAGATNGIYTVYPVGTNPSGIAVNSLTNMAYVAGTNGNYLSIINATSKQVVDRIRVWNNPESVTVDESSNLISVWASGQTTVIDGATNTVLSKVSGTERPPKNIATNSVTGLTYQFEPGDTFVSVTDSATGEHVATISVGDYAVALAIDETRNIIYVTNTSDGTISIIDGSTNTVVDSLPAGRSPHGVAVNYNTNTVYVSNWGQNTATAIDVSDIADDLSEYTPASESGSTAGDDTVDNDTAENDAGETGIQSVTVRSLDSASRSQISGYFVTLSHNDDVIETGFTPVTFSLVTGETYAIATHDYGGYYFNYWDDSNSIDRPRVLTADGTDLALDAIYSSDPSVQPPSDESQSDSATSGSMPEDTISNLYINVVDTNGDYVSSAIPFSLWQNVTHVDSRYSEGGDLFFVLDNDEEYTLAAENSNDYIFDRWLGINSTSAERTLLIDEDEDVTAVYEYRGDDFHMEAGEDNDPETSNDAMLKIMVIDATTEEPLIGYYIEVVQEDGTVVHRTWSSYNTAVALWGGHEYTVAVGDYGGYYFNYWQDDLSTSRFKDVTQGQYATITAVYSTDPNALPPASPEPQPGQEEDTSSPPPATTGKSTLTVYSRDGHTNNRIDGYYTALAGQNDGSIVSSFTPTSFELNNGAPYTISVYDYGQYVFDHWSDTGSTERMRSVSLANSTAITAIYRNINSGPLASDSSNDASSGDTTGTTSPPEPASSTITVSTTDSSGHAISGYYVTLWNSGIVVQSGFSPAEFTVDSSVSYQVAVSDYGGYMFDHWSDSSTNRYHDAQAEDSLTAVYRN